jgi:hypothetical protein
MTDKSPLNAIDPDRLIERVRPRLSELEKQRLDIRAGAIRRFAVIGVITLVVAVGVAIFAAINAGPNAAGISVFVLAGGAVWIGLLVPRAQRRWRDRAFRELMPEVCETFGEALEYERSVSGRDWVKPFEALELVGQWNRGGVEHHFSGEYHGTRFEMVHADLHSESGAGKNRSSVPVFYGLLFRIQIPVNVDPGLSIRPNFGWFARTFGRRAVPTGNKGFDETFLVSVEGGGQNGEGVVAQVLTPSLQQALLELNRSEGRLAFGRPTFHAGFKYDSLYLALSRQEEGRAFGPIRTERRRPFLDVGHCLSTESRLEAGVRAMVDDIGTVYRVIEALRPALESNPGQR